MDGHYQELFLMEVNRGIVVLIKFYFYAKGKTI